MAILFLTACEKVDDVQKQERSKEQNYAARLSNVIISLQDAKDIASRKSPIKVEPCGGGIKLPVFTPQQLDGVITIFDTNNGTKLIDYNYIVGFDIDGDGVNDGTYHQGFYYNRSMVANIIP